MSDVAGQDHKNGSGGAVSGRQATIHLDRMLNIVGLGVRRATAFMALGVRVGNDQTVNSVLLDTNFSIQFMPEDMAVEAIRNVQQDFRVWIVGNGLRELDQYTSIFADRVFEARRFGEFHRRPLTQEAIDEIAAFAGKTSVSEKLKLIAERFGLDTDVRPCMTGLSKARNALTHNMGFVGERHCTHDSELRLSWIGMQFVVGDRVVAGPFDQIHVEKGTQIQFQILPHDRTFPLNSPIVLTPHDLQEIAFTYWTQAQTLVGKLGEQLRDLGIGPIVPAEQGVPTPQTDTGG
jgi:hypothetical protein